MAPSVLGTLLWCIANQGVHNVERKETLIQFFLPALAVLFVGLKITEVIAWSWLLVLAPLWVPVVAWIGFWTLATVLAFGIAAWSGSKHKGTRF